MAMEVDSQEADVVTYEIFPDKSSSGAGDEKSGADAALEQRRDDFLAFLSRYLVDYIWQNEKFHLRPIPGNGNVPAHLSGSVNYGDNVEDEWFIVFLLLELSKHFTDVIIRVRDSDGEFLLIEAADSLPKWVTPETAENRIFLHNGAVHIIPRPASANELAQNPTGPPSLCQALEFIRKQASKTIASDRVQQDILARITGYPDKRLETIHHAQCYVPAGLSAVLDHEPSLIAPIVQAFYHRDNLDLKACITFKHFRPGTRVMRRVKFTRCLYAQLMQQKFLPDRRSGYSMPAPGSSKYTAYDLGMKLAHGAEILCKKYDISDIPANCSTSDCVKKTDTRWQQFVSSLKASGYFRGELDGSAQHKELMTAAEKFYLNSCCTVNGQTRSDDDVGHKILALLKSLSFDMEAMRLMEKNLPPSDDDSWMELTPVQLDAMLNKMSGVRGDGQTGFDAGQIAKGMKAFVNNVSSHEGAEFPSGDDEIQFDPNSFMQSMQKMFEFEEDPDSNSSSEMDEYSSEDELGDAPGSNSRPKPNNKSKPTSPPKTTHKAGKPQVKGKPQGTREAADTGKYLDMKDYLDAMDRELSSTTIGQSFVRKGDKVDSSKQANQPSKSVAAACAQPPKPPPRKKKQNPSSNNNTGASSKNSSHMYELDDDDIDDEDDDFRPVNVDLNAVKNLLDSYGAQQGAAGPASNILGSMGVYIPPPSSSSSKKSRAKKDDDDDF